MNRLIKSLLDSWEPLCSHFLIQKSGNYVAFGSHAFDDMLVIGTIDTNIEESFLISDRLEASVASRKCEELYKNVISENDSGSISSFNLGGSELKLIQNAARKMSATHLRLSDCEEGIRLSIFDYRRFMTNARTARKHETKLVTHTIQRKIKGKFECILLMQSFLAVKEKEFSVEIAPNGIVRIIPYGADYKYLLRDQGITEPMAHTFSARLGQGISLSLHPKSA